MIEVRDYITDEIILYDNIYIHTEPENDLVSLYNGSICDDNRTIYKIKTRQRNYLSDKLLIWVKKL